ncbi:MAG TPA: dihydropyrimidinase [Anaerolineales bacterium]|nr:dihydropyrimidinase [Anaerolineales bacterium]
MSLKVIKNGTVVTGGSAFQADVLINDDKIVEISQNIKPTGEVIDAAGNYVCPAGVEIHTHIDGILHGMRTVDDWYAASAGAAAGGTATVVDFPMQGENQTLRETVEEFRQRASGKSIVDFSFTPIISQFTEKTYQEIPELMKEGITTFKVFMYYKWKIDDYNLARVLDVVGGNGGIISIHCENAGTIDYLSDRAIRQGKKGPEWHAPTRPVSTEVEATQRVLSVAGELHAPVLIVHISAGPAAVALAKARAEGVPAYGEAMPHFLLLDESCYQEPGYNSMKYVITPPLRNQEHHETLWASLRSGALVTVGSDHCAFPLKDKIRLYETRGSVFPMIPHGAPGIETRVPLIFSEGVGKGRISLTRFVEVVSTNPAKLVGLYPQKGTLSVGSDADIMIIDPKKEVTISQKMLHGNTDYTAFEGWKLKGYPVATLGRGQMLFQNGEIIAKPGAGKFLKRGPFTPF